MRIPRVCRPNTQISQVPDRDRTAFLMAMDSSAASFLYRQLYADGIDQEALVRNKPLMQWTKNDTDFTNDLGFKIPAPYVNPQGIAATNAAANNAEVSSKGVTFTVPQRHHYAFMKIDGDVVRNTINGGSTSQFTNILTREVDGVTEAIGAEIHQRMYGEKTGVRSYLSATSSITTNVLTLANAEDTQFYEPNMRCVLVDPATGFSRTGTAFVIKTVDPITSTLTITDTAGANVNLNAAFAAAAVSDGLARETFASASGGIDFDGLKAWIPSTVSISDSFNGVNRSLYRTRLAGVYVDASALPIRNGFIKALAVAKGQVGSMFESKSPFFINPKNLAQIIQTVESTKINSVSLDDKYGIGLEAVEVFGHKFVEDSMCPVNEAYLIGKNALVRGTCGKQPQIDDQDGEDFWFDRINGKLMAVLAHDGCVAGLQPYNLMRVVLPNVAL
jgi:hypothetical protein